MVLSEGESTERADVTRPPAVDLLVAPQRSRSGEALAAEVTAERFQSCVTPHVRLHVLKSSATDRTRPNAADRFSVRSEMI